MAGGGLPLHCLIEATEGVLFPPNLRIIIFYAICIINQYCIIETLELFTQPTAIPSSLAKKTAQEAVERQRIA